MLIAMMKYGLRISLILLPQNSPMILVMILVMDSAVLSIFESKIGIGLEITGELKIQKLSSCKKSSVAIRGMRFGDRLAGASLVQVRAGLSAIPPGGVTMSST